jgi:DinB superfamily
MRPNTPAMLDQLEGAYQTLLARAGETGANRARLLGVLDDLRWYAERLGATRWETPPRPGRWSFAENLWHIAEQATQEAAGPTPQSVVYYIDHGKEHVGQAAEIFALFEY